MMAQASCRRRGAGEGDLAVEGGHPDGVGDELGLGVELHHVRVVLGERDLRRRCLGCCLGGFELAAGGIDGLVQLGEVLVGDDGGGAGGGAAELVQLALPGGLGGGERFAVPRLTWAEAVFFAGFGTRRWLSSGVTA